MPPSSFFSSLHRLIVVVVAVGFSAALQLTSTPSRYKLPKEKKERRRMASHQCHLLLLSSLLLVLHVVGSLSDSGIKGTRPYYSPFLLFPSFPCIFNCRCTRATTDTADPNTQSQYGCCCRRVDVLCTVYYNSFHL